jgi:hypothetical protein
MKARLKKVCKTCTASSLQTYYYNIKALAKIAGHDEVPNNHRWINAALLKKIKQSLKLMKFKNMTIAGNKALAAYDKKNEDWAKAMQESTQRYNRERDTQKRTKRESENWPKEGYRALTKLANEMYKDVEHLYNKAPAKVTFPELWQMMRQFVILFYSKHALRGDLADVRIKRSGSNYLEKKGKKWHLHVGNHKTVKAHGPIELDLDSTVGNALNKYLTYLRAKTKHGFLLSTKRYGNKLTRKDMMSMIRNTTKERLGKNIGIQMIRVLKTTDHFKSIDESAKLRGELAHGPGMQWKYVSRPK